MGKFQGLARIRTG